MFTRTMCLAGAATLAVGLPACRDASVSPRSDEVAVRPVSASLSSQSGTQHYHSVVNGREGYVTWFYSDASGYSYGRVEVWPSGTVTSPQTNLYFDLYRCIPYCEYFYGYGLIPNRDFSGNAKALHLSTNTATDSGFFSYPGPGGMVVVDWDADGSYVSQQTGTVRVTYAGSVIERQQGSWSDAAATVTGSIFGTAIAPNVSGYVRTGHNVTIDIYR